MLISSSPIHTATGRLCANGQYAYYIVDAKHGRSIVAGDTYDGHLYHQDPTDRPNAKWVLEPTSTADYYYIKDIKYNQYIVADDNYDGSLSHQPHNGRLNAMWRMVVVTDTYGSKSFYLFDMKHDKAIVADDVENNKVYHQDPNGRSNARWAMIPNSIYIGMTCLTNYCTW